MTAQSSDHDEIDIDIRFRETMGFLVKSAREFDAGDHAEALRLATAVRTLSYDEGRGDSVLTQLGVKAQIEWRSFYVPFGFELPPGTPTFGTSLYGHVIGEAGGMGIEAIDHGPVGRSVTYQDWWGVEPVVRFGEGHNTRSQLVLGLANQDGGAHVDLAGHHLEALRGGTPIGVGMDGNDLGPVEQRAFQRDLLHIQMRAVANEVLHTINNAINRGIITYNGT